MSRIVEFKTRAVRSRLFIGWCLIQVLATGFGVTGSAHGKEPLTEAKIADFKARFQQGVALEQKGRLADARALFEGILAEDPEARGSLYYAGLVSVRMEDFAHAINYLNRYKELYPKEHGTIVLLIQAHQALRQKEAVAGLIEELRVLRKAKGFVSGLHDALSFAREKIQRADNSMLIFLEYFDPLKSPKRVWELKLVSPTVPRQLALIWERPPEAPETAKYLLVEFDLRSEKPAQRILRQSKEKPDYETVREWMMDAVNVKE